jgi:hypothetical protein
MIEKSDWEIVYRELIAEGRERLGDPPTAEEVEALFRGELTHEEAERVRELLVYYPEMARVMTQPSPDEQTRVLTEQERAEDWAAIRKRIEPPPRIQPRQLPRILSYAAAVVVAIAGTYFIYEQIRLKTPPPPRDKPVHVTAAKRVVRRELWPDGASRGNQSPSSITLPGNVDELILKPLTGHKAHYDNYRIDIVDLDAAPNRVIWTRSGLPESPDGSFEITVSNQVLKPGGRFQLVLYGISAGKTDRLETYTVRVLTT